jgi:membrane-associated phospholipid phosphatase
MVLGRLAAGLLSAFAAVAVLVRAVPQLPGDRVLTGLFSGAGPRTPALVVDRLTGYGAVALLTGLLVLVLVRVGRRVEGVLCTVSVIGAVAGNALLKQLVRRPRPDLLPASAAVSPFSFPSGHAAATAALVVSLVLLTRGTRALLPAVAAGTLVVTGAAAAQLVLAQHRPSDIVGGWLWAAGWTTAVWAGWRTASRPIDNASGTAGPAS